MNREKPRYVDVSVVGGGPTGVFACLELSKSSDLNTALFESESEIGGIPRRCHLFFGMRDLKRLYTGPAYVKRLESLIRETSVNIYSNATVVEIAQAKDSTHGIRIKVSSRDGFFTYGSRFVLLSTGCFESSQGTRLMPGTRPAGVYTTSSLQDWVNLRQKRPGKRAIIVGSEYVALASLLYLARAGISIAALIEESSYLNSNPLLAKAMSRYYHFPIYKNTAVTAVKGYHRVEAVDLVSKEPRRNFQVACDTVILTGRFHPDSAIIDNTTIQQDPSTRAPVVDKELMTSHPNIFAAGNILAKGKMHARMHDLCALEGRRVARYILARARASGTSS
jgi:thioredoxin reductase